MERLKVFLVNPPAIDGNEFIREGRCMQSTNSWVSVWPPVTLALLASIARRYADVSLADCIVEKVNINGLVRRIEEINPDIIVISAAFPSIDGDRRAAAEIKKLFPGTVILGFGVFFTLLEKESLEFCPEFDAAIAGEPEATFEEFLQCYAKEPKVPDIKGMIRRENGQIVMGPPREFIENLDGLPMPARDLLKNELYLLPDSGEPFTLINSARGCYYPCIYCIAPVYYGKKIRRHSTEYILDEIEACKKDLNIRNFLFWEEVFTFDKEFCMRLCDEFIKRKLNIRWAATTRADCLDMDILLKMKESNCMLLGMGIESGNADILKNSKKGETVESITRAVSMCKEVGIPVIGHFIFGLPGENENTVRESIDLSIKLGLDYMQAYCAVPYPKTELNEMAKRNNWLTQARWCCYDFGGRSILNIGTLSCGDVDRAKAEAFRKFYLRPKYILKQMTSIKSPKRLLNAMNFVKWIKAGK